MNSPRLFFDIYKNNVNQKDVNNLVVLEINTTGKLSSQMWKQLFNTIHVESDITKVKDYEFDICFLNIEDWSLSEQILQSLNYSPRSRGFHEIIIANKVKFWPYYIPNIFDHSKNWGGEQDTRHLQIVGDMGLFPYKLKKPDQTVIFESTENEATVLHYK
jgi:hypothetical protein